METSLADATALASKPFVTETNCPAVGGVCSPANADMDTVLSMLIEPTIWPLPPPEVDTVVPLPTSTLPVIGPLLMVMELPGPAETMPKPAALPRSNAAADA